MKMKHALSLLALASCAAVSTSAMAQSSGDLTIKGFISPVSCTPTLSGSGINGNTLTLPDAFIEDLDTAGKTTGETPFTFAWDGCTTSLGVNNVWVHFHGANVDANGRLTPTTGSNKVRFELLNDGTGGTVITAGGTASNAAPNAAQGTAAAFSPPAPATTNRAASKTYAVRYYAAQAMSALADVGPVSTTVTYTAKYY